MKKLIAMLLAMVMVFSMAACGAKEEKPAASDGNITSNAPAETPAKDEAPAAEAIKVGMVCIGNPNYAYDNNFIMAADKAAENLKAKGIDVEWIYKYDHPVDDDSVTTDNIELAEEGCKLVINNSYGQEPYMLKAAEEYEDVTFVSLTNEGSRKDDLDNSANAFASIYEGRYLAGIAAGMKLNQLIEEGTIKEDEAILGYVGAFAYAEVLSGYTAFYLGAKSVCPSVTMYVNFINSWGDLTEEANATEALIKKNHAVIISQHSDNTSPATTAQEYGVYHVGYNIDMSDVAPNASIISSRIDWTGFFESAIEAVYNGQQVPADSCGSLADGSVVLTKLNTAIAAPGTQEALDAAAAELKSGARKVFDVKTFTADGQEVTEAFAFDTDGDWVPDSENAVIDGEFKESFFQSAPYFTVRIDGIIMNENY